jgi:hypothetical protein
MTWATLRWRCINVAVDRDRSCTLGPWDLEPPGAILIRPSTGGAGRLPRPRTAAGHLTLHLRGRHQEAQPTMNRPPDHDQLLARLEGAALDLRRGSIVIYDVCVSDADGTHVRAADPVLVPEGSSLLVAGIPFTLRSLRHGPRHLPRALPHLLRAAVHNLRGGRRLGSVAMLTRRPGSS